VALALLGAPNRLDADEPNGFLLAFSVEACPPSPEKNPPPVVSLNALFEEESVPNKDVTGFEGVTLLPKIDEGADTVELPKVEEAVVGVEPKRFFDGLKGIEAVAPNGPDETVVVAVPKLSADWLNILDLLPKTEPLLGLA